MSEETRTDGKTKRRASLGSLFVLLGGLERLLALPMRGLVFIYKKAISPFLPKACRFYPSCSAYADESFKRFGLFRGGALTAWRLMRCQPFSRGGFDPVPGSIPPGDSASCRSHHVDEDSSRCCV
jgi:putative membrane protein insertion efficiency factor